MLFFLAVYFLRMAGLATAHFPGPVLPGTDDDIAMEQGQEMSAAQDQSVSHGGGRSM